MPIEEPGRGLMHHVGLKFVAKKVAGGGGRGVNAALSLTSMIDFLVVTVVFLLMTFSASGETPVSTGVNLPKAENTLDMIDAPIVAVAGSQVIVDGAPAETPEPSRTQAHAARRRALQHPEEQARAVEADAPRARSSRASSCSRSIRTSGHRREERFPDLGFRRLPERQLHGQLDPQDAALSP